MDERAIRLPVSSLDYDERERCMARKKKFAEKHAEEAHIERDVLELLDSVRTYEVRVVVVEPPIIIS